MRIPKTFIPEKELGDKFLISRYDNDKLIKRLKDLVLGEDYGFYNVKCERVSLPEENSPFYSYVKDDMYIGYGNRSDFPVACVFEFENPRELEMNTIRMVELADRFNSKAASYQTCVIAKESYAIFVYGCYADRKRVINAYKKKFGFEEITSNELPQPCPDRL
ncbi:hypothetical protein FJZ53_07070 [Candidatus Woesearchaeota archaeon]|nr:hypothetical protein [Candidatus Woesearchaeota archaeon]